MKEIIFITKQGTKLKRKDNQIIAILGTEKIGAFPINRIKKIFLFGNIEITMPAVNFLLSKNAEIYLLSQVGNFKGLITNTKLESNYNLRLTQYRAFINENSNLETAKFFVLKKIISIEKFTQTDLKELKNGLSNAKRYKEILGIEGTASAFFFDTFRKNLKINLGFKKREYRPAKDPVNALLSFVYSLFYSLLFSFIKAKGFDPYIGYLHRKRGTHAVLASDFMEIFRVELSKFILILFNNEVFTPADFEKSTRGVYLKEESLRKFLEIFKENFIDQNKYISKMEQATNEFIKVLGV
ncbi:MAG: CRISPR-associated endonuclease Cas1 [Aquificae bacterium]|nr:CRISPR-associated endonuclease Cas1 [Aquificota bacterium]